MNIILRLITNADLSDYNSIKRLKDWRKKNRYAYPGNYKITHKSVRKWLKETVIENPDRFLFWIMVDGKFIGHIGVRNIKKNSIEIDNIARGVDNYKGVMHEALNILITTYADKKVWLCVLPNNNHAINFYKRNGFKAVRQNSKFLIMQHE